LFVVLNAVYVVLMRSAPTAWRGVEDYLDTWIVLEQGPQVVGLVALPVLGFVLAALHQLAPPARREFSHTALLFGFAFITVTWTGYFLQVAWLIPHIQDGSRAGIEMMAFRNNAGLAWAVDVAGWALSGFMGVALFGVFPGRGLEARLRRLFLGYGVANLLLLPWLMFDIASLGIPIIASWLLVLPAATAQLAIWFRRTGGTAETDEVGP
jgi:hypothetical protein